MLTVFKIRDTYKIIENATGLSSDEQHDFVQRYNGGDHVFSTREEAEERMSTLPVDTDGGKYRRVHNYDVWVVIAICMVGLMLSLLKSYVLFRPSALSCVL